MNIVKAKSYGKYSVTLVHDEENNCFVVTRKSKCSFYQERYQNVFDAMRTYDIFKNPRAEVDRIRGF